MSKTIRYLK